MSELSLKQFRYYYVVARVSNASPQAQGQFKVRSLQAEICGLSQNTLGWRDLGAKDII